VNKNDFVSSAWIVETSVASVKNGYNVSLENNRLLFEAHPKGLRLNTSL
jgi:hypothetical protein